MAVATRVSLEEYLNTEYEPDCDYVDGVLEQRNVGKKRHARTQTRAADEGGRWRAAVRKTSAGAEAQ
jgi:hypothetical protein